MDDTLAKIKPFFLKSDPLAIADLKERLGNTRWPEPETVTDWSQGVPLAYTQKLAEYWRTGYDWDARLAQLARFDHFTTPIDELDIHFIHQRSSVPGARPLLITHGWPGSVFEFHKIIDALTDPVAHGGKPEDAFHVVCPSLPGFGFSGKPDDTGWGVTKIAETWDKLMVRLGYERYFAQGGDWGATVTTAIGLQDRGHCAGIHLTMIIAAPPASVLQNPTPASARALAALKHHEDWGTGYSKQQSTRPQTLGYGLVDSPVAQLAWIVEKYWAWTDCDGHPENAVTRDEILDCVMMYWLTASGSSSAKLYWESFGKVFNGTKPEIELPAGFSSFPKEVAPAPKSWVEPFCKNLVYFNEPAKGGHFPALEQPERFVNELRACFSFMSL